MKKTLKKFSIISGVSLLFLFQSIISLSQSCNTITLYLINSTSANLYLVPGRTTVTNAKFTKAPPVLAAAGKTSFEYAQVAIDPGAPNGATLVGQLAYGDKDTSPTSGCAIHFTCTLTSSNGAALCVQTSDNSNAFSVVARGLGASGNSKCKATILAQPNCTSTDNKNAQGQLEVQ